MNIASMRVKYKLQLAGLADGTADADIDVLMNRAYQFTLPTRIPGEMFEGMWQTTVSTISDTVAYADHIMHLNTDGAKVGNLSSPYDDEPMRVWTSEAAFFHRWERQAGSGAKPTDVLMRGRELIFRPSPGAAYYVYFTGKIAPDSGVPDPDGFADENLAMAVVLMAALETAQDNQLDALEAKLNKRLSIYLAPLIENSLGRPHNRRYVRTF